MEKINDRFSLHISNLRKEHNFTQEEAAEILKASSRCFQKWENGATLPDFLHILYLVHYMNFDFNAFTKEVFDENLLNQEDC